MPNTITARGTDANGTGTPAALNRLVIDTICGVAHLSKELADAIEEHRKKPKYFLPAGYLATYGEDIGKVFDALCARQYEYSTIQLYTHLNGEFMKWLAARGKPDRVTDQELYAFADDYVKNSRESAVGRLGEYSDPEGLTLRSIIFYALRAVLDICFNMKITSKMPRPARPRRVAPAPQDVTEELYGDVQNDRERLVLVLINGLGLMPSEAAALRWDNFNESLEWLEFTVVKSGKKRIITRHVVTGYQHALRGCLERAGGNRDAYIFPSTINRGGEHLCVRSLQYTLERMRKRSDIDRRVTLTTLRLGGSYMPTNWKAPSPAVDNPELPQKAATVSSDVLPTAPETLPALAPAEDETPTPPPIIPPASENPPASALPSHGTTTASKGADLSRPTPHKLRKSDDQTNSESQTNPEPPPPG